MSVDRIRRCLLLGFIASVPFTQRTLGQVDQAHIPLPGSDAWLNIVADERQEFTPSLNQLDTVELLINGRFLAPVSGSFAVVIRKQAFDGEILASSAGTSLPARFEGTALFRFPTPVNLVPDQIYALQPIQIAGGSTWFVNYGAAPGYTQGNLYVGDQLLSHTAALFFREGIGIPEPSPAMLLAVGLGLAFAARCWRSGAWRLV